MFLVLHVDMAALAMNSFCRPSGQSWLKTLKVMTTLSNLVN